MSAPKNAIVSCCLFPCLFRLGSYRRILLACLLAGSGCARMELEDRERAMRKVTAEEVPAWNDDLPLKSLIEALEKNRAFLEKSARFPSLQFGDRVVSSEEYALGIDYMVGLLKSSGPREEVWESVLRDFDFYQVYGRERWGEVLVTSYFEPVIRGRRRKKFPYTQPLYKLPSDLVEMSLSDWERPELEDAPSILRGRLIKGEPSKVVPYYSRREIDAGKAGSLRGRRLEWCYVRPVDAFFLQIQGSGTVLLPRRRSLRLGYAGQNGHPYRSLGNFLLDVIPREEMSLQSIEAHLATLTPGQRQRLFNKNPSYVFFKRLEEHALTYMGLPATAGRSVATDARFFPKGAVALLIFEKPRFSSPEATRPESHRTVSRLVLDQDVGGAIKGGGRLDLFWGRGREAKQHAGVVNTHGQLLYIVPSRELIGRLAER